MSRSLKNSLRLSKARLLFIDSGSRVGGFCITDVWIKDRKLHKRIIHFGKIKLDATSSLQDRVIDFSIIAGGIFLEYNPDMIYIEHPPDTIYGFQRLSKAGIVARAQSVFKVIAVCHGVASHLRTMNTGRNSEIEFIFPSQWQPSKKQRGGLDSKEWSLATANKLLSKHYHKPFKELKTKEEENVADAIAMSVYAVKKMLE